jgi:hypothetical protein
MKDLDHPGYTPEGHPGCGWLRDIVDDNLLIHPEASAFLISALSDGHEVVRRPRTAPASVTVPAGVAQLQALEQ